MESDVFKFHVRKLINLAYVEKLSSGGYRLTLLGKEFANNLDKATRTIQKQPKCSLLLIASKPGINSETLYLFQQRRRQPHWGYWGFLSGPLRWGANAEDAAAHELQKQTGVVAEFGTAGFIRQRDYNSQDGQLLEDKLFQIMKAANIKHELISDYSGGYSEWMTLEQLKSKDKYFEPTQTVIEMLNNNQAYLLKDVTRLPDDY